MPYLPLATAEIWELLLVLAISLLMLYWGQRGLRNGIVHTSSGSFEREKQGYLFWFFTTMFLTFGALMLVMVIIMLFDGE